MLNDFISLFFPPCCLLCKTPLIRSEKLICTTCFWELPLANAHLEEDNPVAEKFYGKVALKHAMAFYKFRKGSKIQLLLYQLKYKNKPQIGEIVGRKYGSILRDEKWHKAFDLIIPVPLAITKLRQRGYNQSAFFAKGLSEALAIPWSDRCLKRVKETLSQTRKDRLARWKNVATVFSVENAMIIRGKRILLVDDVVTTGATLEACALTLLAAKSKEVSVATIAVAL
ncbi:MAG: ComF family protein [Cytophagales bacterium]|nr:ComF family protein [Cytophagales bacterium]